MGAGDAPRRGRPRAFDREAALGRAMAVFWGQGYDATSMADLVEAMGINSPSIYAAFGSKEGLFREAVALYAESDWRGATAELPTARAVVEAMFRSSVERFTGWDPPRGCLVVLGAVDTGGSPDSVRRFLREHRAALRDAFAARLERAVEEGELPPDTHVPALVAMCFTFLHGLSVQTADGVPRDVLLAAVDGFMAGWDSAIPTRR